MFDPNDSLGLRLVYVAGLGILYISPFSEDTVYTVYKTFGGQNHDESISLEGVIFTDWTENPFEKGAILFEDLEFVDPRHYFVGARLRF